MFPVAAVPCHYNFIVQFDWMFRLIRFPNKTWGNWNILGSSNYDTFNRVSLTTIAPQNTTNLTIDRECFTYRNNWTIRGGMSPGSNTSRRRRWGHDSSIAFVVGWIVGILHFPRSTGTILHVWRGDKRRIYWLFCRNLFSSKKNLIFINSNWNWFVSRLSKLILT